MRKSERTRLAILAAATVEFARKGLDGARVDAIAARSRLNKNLIYMYFGNKEALFQAVLENSYRELRETQDRTQVTDLDPITAMKKFVSATYRGILATPEILSLAASENVHRAIHIKKSKLIRQLYVGIPKTLNALYRRGCEDGVFRPGLDMIELYITIVSVCGYHISNQYTLSELLRTNLMSPRRIKSREGHSISMILRYLCRDPDRRLADKP